MHITCLVHARAVPVVGVAPQRNSRVADPDELIVLDERIAVVSVPCELLGLHIDHPPVENDRIAIELGEQARLDSAVLRVLESAQNTEIFHFSYRTDTNAAIRSRPQSPPEGTPWGASTVPAQMRMHP
jgi:hypothetical protein